jgi:plasmid stabilization system protein ParE
MKLRVLPEAFRDLAEAVDWYNNQQEGLGEEFESLFYTRVESLTGNSLRHAVAYRDIRRILLNKFPYAVYYRIHLQEIVISLIFHSARNPIILRRLLRSRPG